MTLVSAARDQRHPPPD